MNITWSSTILSSDTADDQSKNDTSYYTLNLFEENYLMRMIQQAHPTFAQQRHSTKLPQMLSDVSHGLRINPDVYHTNKFGHTALHIAAHKQISPILKLLLAQGGYDKVINEQNRNGCTALHILAHRKERDPEIKKANRDSIRILLEYGASLYIRDNNLCTPGDLASPYSSKCKLLNPCTHRLRRRAALMMNDLIYSVTPRDFSPLHSSEIYISSDSDDEA